jgi:hypothetical protein
MTDRRPRVGDYITWASGDIAYVCADVVQGTSVAKTTGMLWIPVDAAELREEDRGLTWALGTEGEEVEALKVAQALR